MESNAFVEAGAGKPLAAYIGGKRVLVKRLVERIELLPHRTYAEPFVGMGGVFFRRRTRPAAEVINDWSRDIATLYRVLQRHYVAFTDMLRFQITTRAEFERLSATCVRRPAPVGRQSSRYGSDLFGFSGSLSQQRDHADGSRPSPG